jgi:hypothetical protein
MERLKQRSPEPQGDGTALTHSHAHLIRISDRMAMNRAVLVLGEVRSPYCGFTDSRLLVTTEHVEVLRSAGISFETLS